MSNSREVSQFSNFIVVDDSNRNIGIATTATPYVGIGTTNPQYKLDVVGDLNFTGTLRQNGSEYSSGIQNVVEDTTPQLGGNLDLNGKTINGSGGVNITGVVTATSFTGNLTGTASTTTNIPNLTGDVTSNGTVTSIASGVIVNADINASAGIVDTKLATISTAGKVSNSATTATNANTASAIVARDGSGNFSAGTITANLTGTATTATNVTVTTSTTNSAFKVPFANTTANTTGNYGLLQDSTATFTYNPSTDTLVAGTFSGSGASLTSLNADNLSSGTVPDARLSGTYTGISINTTGIITATSFSGSGASLTSLNADNISSGTLVLARGGTNASLAASNGGIVYSTSTAMAILAGTATAGQILRSGASGAPSWSTATYPATTTQNRILFSSSANVIGEITSANTGALITNSTGVPSFTSGTTANRVLRTDGSTISFSQVTLTSDVTGTLPIANGGTNSTATPTNGGVSYGTGSAFAFTSAGTLGQILTSSGAGAPVWSSNLNVSGVSTLGITSTTNLTAQQLNVSGVSTIGNLRIDPVGTGATVGGIGVTYYGDGSQLSGVVSPASNGEFYTGVSSSLQLTPLSYETSIYTFPATAGRQYVIESINVANVDTSVGVGTTVNIIASIEDSSGEQTYIAYNVPIVNGGLIELLKNPIVAGPSDVIKMWTTDGNYIGVNTAAEVYMNYSEFTSTEYISEYASTVSIASTDITTVYTSSTYPSVIESIHLANRTDTGDYPVSVTITNGLTTTYLAKDLLIPRYATVDILDRPKRIELNGTLGIKVGQTSTIDVIIAGKQITS